MLFSLLQLLSLSTEQPKARRRTSQKKTTQIALFAMAVEARHLSLSPSQLIQDRYLMNQPNQSNAAAYTPQQQMRFLGIPFAASLPENQSLYQPAVCGAKTSVNTDSGLTYNIPAATRKRSRDSSINQFYASSNYPAPAQKNIIPSSQFPSLAGEDIMPQIHQYQLEIDAIISQHTKKIRLEIEERQKQQARMLAAAIGEGVMKKLKEKEDQIQRMGKLNLVLQERVKSLYAENQLWRDLAQSNEAAANSLRSNLEQILLLQVGGGDERVEEDDDVESCCGSSDHAAEGQDKDDGRRCKRCGDREASVLLLPCRHLCLCNVCGSGSQQVRACPVCNSTMDATLHVNMSG